MQCMELFIIINISSGNEMMRPGHQEWRPEFMTQYDVNTVSHSELSNISGERMYTSWLFSVDLIINFNYKQLSPVCDVCIAMT